jgi:hypothetical protein
LYNFHALVVYILKYVPIVNQWGREVVEVMQGGEWSASSSGSFNPENPLDMRLDRTQTPSGHCGDEKASL